mgnify:FL=1
MTKLYVGVTDTNWFLYLKEQYKKHDLPMYINFWTPGSTSFKVLEAGELFLFKLHKKKNSGVNGEVVGGGYFSHFERLTMSDAWKKYGIGNGAATFDEMCASLKRVKEKNNVKNEETIGCIILKDVFFFDKLIEEPSDWKKSIVRGKSYTLEDDIGKELYLQVNKQLPKTR